MLGISRQPTISLMGFALLSRIGFRFNLNSVRLSTILTPRQVGRIRAGLFAVQRAWNSLKRDRHPAVGTDDQESSNKQLNIEPHSFRQQLIELETDSQQRMPGLFRVGSPSVFSVLPGERLSASCVKLARPLWALSSHHYFRREDAHLRLRCGSHGLGGAHVAWLKRPYRPADQLNWLRNTTT